ncbi:MAG: type II toxin-antitoxin system VapC family toxin [Opitutales bacterium]
MVLVDSNVLLDILTRNPIWFGASRAALGRCQDEGIAINPLIFAEVSAGYHGEAQVRRDLSVLDLDLLVLPYTAAFAAGKAFVEYRRRGGVKTSPLPDFYIGAHALTAGMPLLTRDPNVYETYFPGLEILQPARA